MKQAEACGCGSIPTLNQTGLLKAAFREAGEVLRGREVGLLLRPSGDGVDHARDEAAHAGLAVGGSELPPEVFRGHDVGGGLAPSGRNLDAVLLEDGLAALVVDDRGSQLPRQLVIRMSSGFGEVARVGEALGGGALVAAGLGLGVLDGVGGHERLRKVGSEFYPSPGPFPSAISSW
jgi:hypothetical protein